MSEESIIVVKSDKNEQADSSENKLEELAHLFADPKIELSIIENSPICSKIIDLDRRLQYMSRGGIEALKIKDISKFYNKPYPPEEFPKHMHDLYDAHFMQASQGIATSFECPIPDMEGGEEWYLTNLTPIKNKEGQIIYIFASSANISKRKELELYMINTQQKLINASKITALGEMAAGVAHEINNPLGSIILRSNQIRRAVEREEISSEFLLDVISTIESTGARIKQIVEGLQNFSRSGDEVLSSSKKLKDLFNEVLILCRERYVKNSIDFTISDIPDDIEIHCNAAQMSQVILGILNNAYHAVKQEDPELRWIKISIEEKEDIVELQFTDSGKGVPEDFKEKIFQPFFTTKDVGEGTGLGLSIAMGIVKNHRGFLYLDESNKNTCFTLELPKLK